MATVTNIQEELQTLSILKFVSDAFIETSVIKIKNIRQAFEANRSFFDEISQVYHLVKINAEREKKLTSQKKIKESTSVSIALTANQRFYGSANVNTLKEFISGTEKTPTDRIVIGTTGIDYLNSINYTNSFIKLQFARDIPTSWEAVDFMKLVKPYDRVTVYYTKFISLLTQSVGIMDIAQSATIEKSEPRDTIHVLFEPELPFILEFFESQIRLLLFLRVILESDLARTAARLIAMSAAEQRIEELTKEKNTELRKTKLSNQNRELLAQFSGMKYWKEQQ